MFRTFVAIATLLCLPLVASAQTFFGGGIGGAIPDGNASGFVSSIDVTVPSDIISFDSVTIYGLSHTWAGDLLITLSDGTTTIDLLDRLGRRTNDMTGDFGLDAVLDGDFTFAIGGTPFPTTGTTIFGTGGPYATYINDSPGESSFADGALSDFNGTSVQKTWTLTVADRSSLDTGSFTGWAFTATITPEPGTLGLMALGVCGGLAARRRK